MLLIVDNHTSHTASEIAEKAKENNVIILTLPPHTSHYTQPLDVGFMSPFKLAIGREERKWMANNVGKKVWHPDVLTFINTAFNECTSSRTTARNAFRACGIVPFDKNIINNKINTISTPANFDVLNDIPIFKELDFQSNTRLGRAHFVTGQPAFYLTKHCTVNLVTCKHLFTKDKLCNKSLNLLKLHKIQLSLSKNKSRKLLLSSYIE